MAKKAIDYAHLIGKYIRAEKPKPDGDIDGGAGIVVTVYDYDISGVAFMFDYGMGFLITPEEEDKWVFYIAELFLISPEEKAAIDEINTVWGNNSGR